MSDDRIDKAVQFLKNPKSKQYPVAHLPIQKKIEFLHGKLPPHLIEEVIKRSSSDDFSRIFEETPKEAPKPQFRSYFGLVGAAILGAIGFTFLAVQFMQTSAPSKATPPCESLSERPAAPDSTGHLERLIQAQTEALEKLSSQIANIQFAIETLKGANGVLPVELVRAPSPGPTFVSFLASFDNEETKQAALRNLKLWFSNVKSDPSHPQKRKINLTTPSFKKYLVSNSQTSNFLLSAGFELTESFAEFRFEDLPRLEEALNLIEAALSHVKVPTFSSSSPWLATQSLEPDESAD